MKQLKRLIDSLLLVGFLAGLMVAAGASDSNLPVGQFLVWCLGGIAASAICGALLAFFDEVSLNGKTLEGEDSEQC